ncbi:MAG: hypothetical protein QOH23_2371 [Gaiellaceae bacterium]|nr:hypothetical protein [Gaiellaceae bacterium]
MPRLTLQERASSVDGEDHVDGSEMSVRSEWRRPHGGRDSSSWEEGAQPRDEAPGKLETAGGRLRGRLFLLVLFLAQLLWLGVGAFALYRLVT